MVRAAFKGDGRNFHQPLASFSVVGMAQDKNDNASGNRDQSSSDEAALSARLGSLDHRLSEIRDNRKIRTDQPGTESGDTSCQSFCHGAWFPPLLGIGRGRCRWGGDWLGVRPFIVDIAVRFHRVSAARLRRRRGQRGEICRRRSRQALSVDGKSRHLKFDCRPGRWIKSRADENRPDPPVQYRTPLHDRPYRQPHDRLYQLVALHAHHGGGDLATDDRRHGERATGSRAAAVDR